MSKWRCMACGCTESDCECLDCETDSDVTVCNDPEEDFVDAGSILDIEYDR